PGDLADTKQLLTSSGLGGIADWRIAEDEGTWDTATYGSVDDYMDTVFGAAIEHSSLRFATLSDSACRSEWVIGATPEGSVCSGQVAGDVWEPLLEYGRRMGTRYAVTEVRAATPEVTGSQWSIEVDMVNLADGRDFSDRQIEFGFLDRSNREPLDTLVLTPDPPLTQWTPGQTVTLLVDVPTAGLNAEDPAAYSLYVRILDERAFGGGIELAHDDRDDSG
ncbi:MAG: hypothetical protein GY884_15650, partial [Proteobacteria bacterium]|nr:hypothetical protein [Pseudomonadota bacterium]